MLIDSSSIGKFTTTVLIAVFKMERDRIVNRTQDGKKYAKNIILIIERGV